MSLSVETCKLYFVFVYSYDNISVNMNHMMSLLCIQLNRFKNVIFEIGPTDEVGDFEVKAKFMGVQMETFMLHYQV